MRSASRLQPPEQHRQRADASGGVDLPGPELDDGSQHLRLEASGCCDGHDRGGDRGAPLDQIERRRLRVACRSPGGASDLPPSRMETLAATADRAVLYRVAVAADVQAAR